MTIIVADSPSVQADPFALAYSPPADPIRGLPLRVRVLAQFLRKPTWTTELVDRVAEVSARLDLDWDDATNEQALGIVNEVDDAVRHWRDVTNTMERIATPKPDYQAIQWAKDRRHTSPNPVRIIKRDATYYLDGARYGFSQHGPSAIVEHWTGMTEKEQKSVGLRLVKLGYGKLTRSYRAFDRFSAYCQGKPPIRVSQHAPSPSPEPSPEPDAESPEPEPIAPPPASQGPRVEAIDPAPIFPDPLPVIHPCERTNHDPGAETCRQLGYTARDEGMCLGCYIDDMIGHNARASDDPGAYIARRVADKVAEMGDYLGPTVRSILEWGEGPSALFLAQFDAWLKLIGSPIATDPDIDRPRDRLFRWDEFLARCREGSPVTFPPAPTPTPRPEGAPGFPQENEPCRPNGSDRPCVTSSVSPTFAQDGSESTSSAATLLSIEPEPADNPHTADASSVARPTNSEKLDVETDKPNRIEPSRAETDRPTTLVIKGDTYAVTIHPEGIEITHPEGRSHLVMDGPDGPECSCPSYFWRGVPCRHLTGLREAGLLPPLPGFPDTAAPIFSEEPMPEPKRCACCKEPLGPDNAVKSCGECGATCCEACLEPPGRCDACTLRREGIDPDCDFRAALAAFGLPMLSGGSPEAEEEPIQYRIEFSPEPTPPHLCFPDDEDRVARIREGIDAGNPWAWCHIAVIASLGDVEEAEHLARCSYESEDHFRASPHYARMVKNATRWLNRDIAKPAGNPPPISGGSPEADEPPEDTLLALPAIDPG